MFCFQPCRDVSQHTSWRGFLLSTQNTISHFTSERHSMIQFKPISSYYSDDDKAVIARKAELAAAGKCRKIELAEVDATIAKQGDTNPNPDDQVQSLIAGIDVPRPQPLSAKRTELQYIIRDIE